MSRSDTIRMVDKYSTFNETNTKNQNVSLVPTNAAVCCVYSNMLIICIRVQRIGENGTCIRCSSFKKGRTCLLAVRFNLYSPWTAAFVVANDRISVSYIKHITTHVLVGLLGCCLG